MFLATASMVRSSSSVELTDSDAVRLDALGASASYWPRLIITCLSSL